MTAFEFQSQVISLQGFVEKFAKTYLRNEEDARDLAQETLLKAISNYDKFRTNTNLKGWLRVIMRNIFINGYRRNSGRVVQYDSELYAVQRGETDFYGPDARLGRKEIDQAIEDLSDDLRIPFTMHVAGYKYHEIAEQLDLPIGTVKSRIFQARKVLSQKLNYA